MTTPKFQTLSAMRIWGVWYPIISATQNIERSQHSTNEMGRAWTQTTLGAATISASVSLYSSGAVPPPPVGTAPQMYHNDAPTPTALRGQAALSIDALLKRLVIDSLTDASISPEFFVEFYERAVLAGSNAAIAYATVGTSANNRIAFTGVIPSFPTKVSGEFDSVHQYDIEIMDSGATLPVVEVG